MKSAYDRPTIPNPDVSNNCSNTVTAVCVGVDRDIAADGAGRSPRDGRAAGGKKRNAESDNKQNENRLEVDESKGGESVRGVVHKEQIALDEMEA